MQDSIFHVISINTYAGNERQWWWRHDNEESFIRRRLVSTRRELRKRNSIDDELGSTIDSKCVCSICRMHKKCHKVISPYIECVFCYEMSFYLFYSFCPATEAAPEYWADHNHFVVCAILRGRGTFANASHYCTAHNLHWRSETQRKSIVGRYTAVSMAWATMRNCTSDPMCTLL